MSPVNAEQHRLEHCNVHKTEPHLWVSRAQGGPHLLVHQGDTGSP